MAVFGLIMPASGVADHALHLDNHLPGFERLAKKAAVGGNIDACQFQLPGYHDDLDRRPALMHRMREFQTIHTARHLDIGEKATRYRNATRELRQPRRHPRLRPM